MKKKWQHKLLLFLAPFVYKVVMGFVITTCRKEMHGKEIWQELVDSGKPFILTFWHYNVLYASLSGGRLPMVAMVSPSKDGEFIARIMESKGITTVRGSRSKGGVGAIKGLLKAVRRGLSPVIIADGSQGPAQVVQGGSIIIAGRAGIPIVPMNWAFSRYKLFRSWDKTLLPLPFARLVWVVGEPLQVPKGLDGEEVEAYRLLLEERLASTYEAAWAAFGKKNHEDL
ncbi:MAG: lysophospholipid acyltransferase family protein [Desulfurivibrionaceae bacterium]|nr:lysophospholipid acyltransferase family protein [Desulfurivibrionaceae bacterium]